MGIKVVLNFVFWLVFAAVEVVEMRPTAAGMQTLEVKKHLKRLNKPAVKSIKSPDGDIIDCIHISHQHAFDHPSFKNHTIQLRPSYHPEGLFSGSKSEETETKLKPITQLWHMNGRCPEGTIPVRRTKKEDLMRASSVSNFGKKKRASMPVPKASFADPQPDLVNQYGYQLIVVCLLDRIVEFFGY